MADRLASIYGTEKDKVNCSFYFKIGACRHGDECSRKHVKPLYSTTILIPNAYVNPVHSFPDHEWDPAEVDRMFNLFYEDIFTEASLRYGEIDEIRICDNVGDHLIGNVYIRFRREEDAERAMQSINKRFYGGRPMYAELSPVTDFGEACCRQFETGECTRSGFCNFMHVKKPAPDLERELFAAQYAHYKNKERR